MSKSPLDYGRYPDGLVGCPRATSDMTPCIARDGQLALADNPTWCCMGCGADPLKLLAELRHEITGKSPAPVTIPSHAADKLRDLVREVTK